MELRNILTPPKNIAVIGLSDKPDRPSYSVANYLISQGFNIIPVNPTLKEVLGQKSYPSLSAIPKDIKIDIVDIFRNSEAVPAIVQEVIDLGIKPFIWMQEGVVSQEAKEKAELFGLNVSMNLCIKKEHQKLD